MPAKAFPEMGINAVYVDDVADGNLLAHDKGKVGESYVLGGECARWTRSSTRPRPASGKKAPGMTILPLLLKLSSPLGPVIGPGIWPPAEPRRGDQGLRRRDLLGRG